MMKNLKLKVVLLVLASLILTGCGGTKTEDLPKDASIGQEGARVIQVKINNYKFEPDKLEVQAGEQVTFHVVNQSSIGHTFTLLPSKEERDKELVNLLLNPNQDARVSVKMPEEPGELYFYCKPHEGNPFSMIGSIIIGEGG
ncbi:MAG: cupredoxin domain-containing protein [Clostridia bacterium]|nr:cupredoxin domain-containing protein [Clostridia bacterium]